MPFALLLVWLGIIVLVGPGGDFPQNDDFAYAKIVSIFVERGVFEFGNYVATNLLTNVFWGAAFAWLFGDNFEALRLSTLVAAAGGLLAIYGTIRRIGGAVSTAALATLSVIISPLFLWHAFSFMSDVPFMAAEAASVFLLVRGLDRGRPWHLLLGWGFGLVAMLSRQTALAIPLAYAVAILLTRPIRLRSIAVALLPLLIFAAVQSAFERWLIATDNVSASFGRQMAQIPDLLTHPGDLAERCALFAWRAYLYLGLFFLPASLWVVVRWLRSQPVGRASALGGAFAVASTIASALAIWRGDRMPIWWNTWNAYGFDMGAHGMPTPDAILWLLTFAGCCGGALLTGLLLRALWLAISGSSLPPPRRCLAWFALAGFAASSAAIALAEPGWDRYLIGLFPWAVAVIAVADPAISAAARLIGWVAGLLASAISLALACYAVCTLYNATSERRVMAALVDGLVASGIDREHINAGWVFDSVRTSRVADYENQLAGKVPFFVRQQGTLTGDFDLIATAPVPRIGLWGAPNPPEAVYRRRQ